MVPGLKAGCAIQSHVLLPVEKRTGWRNGQQRHGKEAMAGAYRAHGLALDVPPDPAALLGEARQASPPPWYH